MKTFNLQLCDKLSCDLCTLGNNAYLCVRPEIAKGNPILPVRIIQFQEFSNVVGYKFNYVIEYDPGLLTDPELSLTRHYVKGVICNNCLTTYVDWQIKESIKDPFVFHDSVSIDFGVYESGGKLNISADAVVSSLPGNTLTIEADGLYVPAPPPHPAIDPINTQSVTLLVGGVDGHELQADVNISSLPGNILVVGADGLYVPTPPPPPAIDPTNTSSVTLLVSGLDGHELQADVNLSALPDNILTIEPDGLYVPAPPALAVEVEDPVTGSGVVGDPLGVKLSTDPGNALVLGTDGGMYVPPSAGGGITCADILATTPKVLPATLVNTDATTGCPSKTAVQARSVVFGRDSGSGELDEDALVFRYDKPKKVLIIGPNSLADLGATRSINVGTTIRVAAGSDVIVAGSTLDVTNANRTIIAGGGSHGDLYNSVLATIPNPLKGVGKSLNSLVTGEPHQSAEVTSGVMAGADNNLISLRAVTSGNTNILSSVEDSVVSGSLNTTQVGNTSLVKDSLLAGKRSALVNVDRSVVVGDRHASLNVEDSVVAGYNIVTPHLTRRSITAGYYNEIWEANSVVAGSDNRNISMNTLVVGRENYIGVYKAFESQKSDSNIVGGLQNIIQSDTEDGRLLNSIIAGQYQTLTGVSNKVESSLIMGSFSDIRDVELINALVVHGDNHEILGAGGGSISHTTVEGHTNKLTFNTAGTIGLKVGGNNNTITGPIRYSSVYGESNVVTVTNICEFNDLNGVSCTYVDNPGSVLHSTIANGSNNHVDGTTASLVLGTSLIVSDVVGTVVTGLNNNISLSERSIVGGTSNTIVASGSSLIIGTALNIAPDPMATMAATDSIVSGNTVNSASTITSSIIGGGNLLLTDIRSSLIVGRYCNVGDSLSSLVTGDSHTVTGELEYSGVTGRSNSFSGLNRAVLVGGRRHYLTDSSDSFVVGSDNVCTNAGQAGAIGLGLVVNQHRQIVVGTFNIPDAATPPQGDYIHQFIVGVGPGDLARRNAYAILRNRVHQWYPPSYVADSVSIAAAITALNTVAVTNVTTGALAMATVSGVPHWFAYGPGGWVHKF